MKSADIEARCNDVAQSTGLPVDWVRHHVHHRAGQPCRRCDGEGFYGRGVCFRCGGSGGRASHTSVANALEWIRANVEHVRALGERREAKAPERAALQRHQLVIEVETWKRDHAELWEFVEDMFPCEFKSSMIKAIEAGRLTPDQEAALWQMVHASKRRSAPTVGTSVEVRVRITSARHSMDHKSQPVFRVDFTTKEGWSGRVETSDAAVTALVQGRISDDMLLKGDVQWSREGYAILAGKSKFERLW